MNNLEPLVAKAAQSDAAATMDEHLDLHVLHVRAVCRLADQMSDISDSLMRLGEDIAELRAAIATVDNSSDDTPPASGTPAEALDTRAAAAYLGVNYFTLSRWRAEGLGPEFVQMGPRIVRYRRASLDAFIASRSQGES